MGVWACAKSKENRIVGGTLSNLFSSWLFVCNSEILLYLILSQLYISANILIHWSSSIVEIKVNLQHVQSAFATVEIPLHPNTLLKTFITNYYCT